MRQKFNKIMFLRKSKIMSQKDMADKLGISQVYYGRLEKNPRKLSIELALKIKDILGVMYIDELLDDVS